MALAPTRAYCVMIAVGVAAALDHLVLGLALRGDEHEAGLFDDLALDVDVAEVVVGNQDALFLSFMGVSFRGLSISASGVASPRRCTRSWYFTARSRQPPVSSWPTVCAVQLLPRRLVLELGRRQRLAPRGDLLVGQEDVDARLVEVDANAIAGAQDGEVAAGGGFGRGVEDRRRSRRCRSGGRRRCVGSDVMPRLSSAVGRLHVDHLRRARIAERARSRA